VLSCVVIYWLVIGWFGWWEGKGIVDGGGGVGLCLFFLLEQKAEKV